MEEQYSDKLCDGTTTSWVVDYSTPAFKVGKVKSFTDVVTPSFSRRSRKGDLIFNPMQMSEREIFTTGSGYTIKGTEAGCPAPYVGNLAWRTYRSNESTLAVLLAGVLGTSGGIVSSPTSAIITQAEIDSLVSEVCTKAQANVRGGDTSGLESLVQLNKTFDLIRKPLEGIYSLTKALTSFNKGKKSGKLTRSGADLLAVPASEWLKYRYGILPLVNDIQAVMKSLKSKRGLVRRTSRASGGIERNSTRSLTSNFGVLTTIFEEQRSHSVRVRAMTVTEYVASMQTDLGLTLDQIPKTVWELIPFSFVVDWFVNVNDFVNASTPRVGVDPKGGCYTVEQVIQSTYYVTGASVWSGYTLEQSPTGVYFERNKTKVRVVGLRSPVLGVKSDFRFDKLTRLADTAGLIVQQLKQIVR